MANHNVVNGMKLTTTNDPPTQTCNACMMGKQTCNPIPLVTSTCATEVLGRVFSDICEIKARSHHGNTYYITFTNDPSCLTHMMFLASKGDALAATKAAFAAMENETGCTIKKFCSDNGGEYMSTEFKEYLKSKGISQEFTNPHTPQENGISERKNQTLNDKMRTLLYDFHLTAQHNLMHRQSPLPLSLWEDTLRHALWIENRTPTRSLPKNKMPLSPTSPCSEYLDAEHGHMCHRISASLNSSHALLRACTLALLRTSGHTAYMSRVLDE